MAAALFGCAEATDREEQVGHALTWSAAGAVSCDFELSPALDPLQIAPIIERDRMFMAARPGMLVKHIPFNPATATQRIQTGGRYLFDTKENAVHYLDWVARDFVLDGVHFFDRDYFIDPRCHTWEVIGAVDFTSFWTTHYVIRTERWAAPPLHTRQKVEARWGQIRAEAESRGLSGARLLYNNSEQLIEILHLADRSLGDTVAIGALPSLGLPLLQDGCTSQFDRTQFVVTIWPPFVAGDRGPAAPYPNSPPLPLPYCGDGVCEVSRGEEASACPLDCPPHCGNATCEAAEGENDRSCPGDCRLP
jgi:hypothetical protein